MKMTDNKILLSYLFGIVGICCIVFISGCTGITSSIGSPLGLSVGSTTTLNGVEVTLVEARIFDSYDPYEFYGGRQIPSLYERKNLKAVFKIKNPGSNRVDFVHALGIIKLTNGDDIDRLLWPTQYSKGEALYPGEDTTYTVFYVLPEEGTKNGDYEISKLKQHAEIRMEKANTFELVAKWDITKSFNE